MIKEFSGHTPQIGENCFVAPNAVVLGDVSLGDGSSVWYGAVLRGDVSPIRIGSHTSIQDNCVIHCSEKHGTTIGNRVTIGHGAVLEGCRVEDGALIGMKATVLEGAIVETGSLVAAGSVITPNTRIPAGSLAAGIPAVVRRALSPEEIAHLDKHAEKYLQLSAAHQQLDFAAAEI